MNSGSQFRPPGPPSLDSQQYAEDYNEVKELGALVGSTRTEDQTEIALFWADGPGTETPPGHWNSIAQVIADARSNTLEQNARLFALLNIAMADAAICAWDAKYTFNFWRPVTAIRTTTDGDRTGPAGSPSSPRRLFRIMSPATALSAARPRPCFRCFTARKTCPSQLAQMLCPRCSAAFQTASMRRGKQRTAVCMVAFTFDPQTKMVSKPVYIGQWTGTRYLRPKGNRSR